MKKWILKAIVQKVISYLPWSNKINYLFQKYVTKGVYLSDEYFYDRLGHARDHLNAYKKYANTAVPAICLELGTGWYPVVPICCFLAGAEKIYSVDISFLTSKERIKVSMDKIKEAHDKGVLKEYVDLDDDRLAHFLTTYEKWETLSLEALLDQLNLEYLIKDARALPLADNSIDLVNSNNTFEHIYPVILTPILKEFSRIVKKEGGIMSHFIDMSDHFAHFDKTINIYNFLQFSEQQWSRIDNSIQPQSRLRIDDYRMIYQQLGIPITDESFRAGDLEALAQIKLDAMYAEKTMETNAISHCHFVSKMNE